MKKNTELKMSEVGRMCPFMAEVIGPNSEFGRAWKAGESVSLKKVLEQNSPRCPVLVNLPHEINIVNDIKRRELKRSTYDSKFESSIKTLKDEGRYRTF